MCNYAPCAPIVLQEKDECEYKLLLKVSNDF
jgi:hypothetical protein